METPAAQDAARDAILIVDDTPTNLAVLVDFFMDRGFEVYIATSGEDALEQLRYATPNVILLDVMMPGMDGFETCRRIKAEPAWSSIPVMFMTALSDVADKVKGFEVGAVDYVTKPIQHEEVFARVRTQLTLRHLQQEVERANTVLEKRVAERTEELSKALEEVQQLKEQLEAENVYLKEELHREHNFSNIIGHSVSLSKVLRQVTQVAPTDATVLLLGESGTGKELFARAVHDASKRSARPLVKVNCATLPANLIESELFGHERGAFTGATSRREGRFKLAHRGTLFLDELGELPLGLQAKLLRVLQEGEFEPLGSQHTLKVDVRVIAATNRDLQKQVDEGRFREDLYYRLNVFPILLPPLRERHEDIPPLVHHFLAKHGPKLDRSSVTRVSKRVMEQLQRHTWPGNVRELEHTIERALILSAGSSLALEGWSPRQETATTGHLPTLRELERSHILKALKLTHGRVSGPKGAARILDINSKTLESRMRKLNIKRHIDFE
ncbi:MAG: sigma-54 dependent transcriptional regulator [Myxococcota bacterium]